MSQSSSRAPEGNLQPKTKSGRSKRLTQPNNSVEHLSEKQSLFRRLIHLSHIGGVRRCSAKLVSRRSRNRLSGHGQGATVISMFRCTTPVYMLESYSDNHSVLSRVRKGTQVEQTRGRWPSGPGTELGEEEIVATMNYVQWRPRPASGRMGQALSEVRQAE